MMTMANGIANAQPNVPFLVLIASYSNQPKPLCKDEHVGFSIPAPSCDDITAMKFEGEQDRPITREAEPDTDKITGNTPTLNLDDPGKKAIALTADDIKFNHLSLEQAEVHAPAIRTNVEKGSSWKSFSHRASY